MLGSFAVGLVLWILSNVVGSIFRGWGSVALIRGYPLFSSENTQITVSVSEIPPSIEFAVGLYR